jgi:hypothetical protein
MKCRFLSGKVAGVLNEDTRKQYISNFDLAGLFRSAH